MTTVRLRSHWLIVMSVLSGVAEMLALWRARRRSL
jgi:hypothetical protein